MKKLILFIILLALSITIIADAQEPCSKEKTEAITEYLRVNSIDDFLNKSVMKKIPQYMAELMPYLQIINQRAMQKAMEEINKKQIKEN
jgi:hypothetical protein